jgi:hypothetical protein
LLALFIAVSEGSSEPLECLLQGLIWKVVGDYPWESAYLKWTDN